MAPLLRLYRARFTYATPSGDPGETKCSLWAPSLDVAQARLAAVFKREHPGATKVDFHVQEVSDGDR